MHGQNIIIVAQQNWDTVIGTFVRNMAKEFARHNRVLYVNMPLDINTVLRGHHEPDVQQRIRALRGQDDNLVQVEPNLWVFTARAVMLSANWLPSKLLFKIANSFNAQWLAHSIRKATQTLGFGSYYILQDGLIYPGLELKRLLKPKAFIYNIRDYVIDVPYFQRHGPWAEGDLFRSADLVSTNSDYLRTYALKHNSHSYNIGQGCALAMYDANTAYPEPADMVPIAHPRIVYTGYLTALRLDLALLLTLARERPDWHLVLVGPEDDAFAASELHHLPNVHFLGTKTPEQLAAYLQHADVCINPQLVNNITIGNYPLKIDEYLAMGKPVVATNTSAMEMFGAHVYLATDVADWLRLLQDTLGTHDAQQAAARIAFAQEHTWQATIEKLYKALEEVEGQAPSHPATALTPLRPTT